MQSAPIEVLFVVACILHVRKGGSVVLLGAMIPHGVLFWKIYEQYVKVNIVALVLWRISSSCRAAHHCAVDRFVNSI